MMVLLSVLQDSTAALGTGAGSVFSGIASLFDVDVAWLVRQLLRAGIILLLSFAALRVSKGLMHRLERHLSEEEEGTGEHSYEDARRARTVAGLAYSVARIGIIATAILLVLNLFFPIGPLLAGVGVFGLALSFGAQSLVRDMISGFFILVENQFGVGDIIEVGGTSGVVERMTLRIVALRDVEGVLHIIPNGQIVKVSNKTRGWSRVVLDVGVGYGEQVDEVIAVLADVGREFTTDEEWADDLTADPVVQGVQGLADSAVNVRVVVDTKPGRQWEVKRELNRRIKNRFDSEGIEIPFPQRTVHLRGGPAPTPSR
ncbi:MAG TPA: mechanosensitive ion channel family protein [Gemmatimonadales bacterium]|nr:mechanosensitive ion channel family protein [Gemmatimonadales bacterium]